MNIAIIISKYPADQNIKQHLLHLGAKATGEQWHNNPMYKIDNITIYEDNTLSCIDFEDIDKEIDADLFLFPTIHRSKDNKPSLTVHPIGNWDRADYGGLPQTLSPIPTNYFKAMFKELMQYQTEELLVTVEATHHGPHIQKPTLFIEIGSTEKEWIDKEYGKAIATTIVNTCSKQQEDQEACIILGGTHYNYLANKILTTTGYAVGHICPKHTLPFLTKELLLQAMEKSKASFVAVDWKSLGTEKQRVIDLLENNNIPWKKGKSL